jgi:hypothetical protein
MNLLEMSRIVCARHGPGTKLGQSRRNSLGCPIKPTWSRVFEPIVNWGILNYEIFWLNQWLPPLC